MGNRLLVVGMLLVLSLKAAAVLTHPCDSFSEAYKDKLPEFYCECEYNSFTFAFPIDTMLTEPVWFSATVDDLKQGLSAYWFSNDYVVMDVYAFCMSTVPTFSMTVGPNRMYEMDLEEINKRLEDLGNSAAYLTTLIPHIHVYTLNGGTGRVYCYPYDQGPHSTCENTLEMRPGMTFVCDQPENVYRLPYSSISSQGHAFIHWKHKPKKTSQNSQPAEVWITKGACDGTEVGRMTMTDSLHVYLLDSAMLVGARKAKTDLWVHVQHAEGIAGRLRYVNNPKYAEPLTDLKKSTCVGKTITVNERTYASDTAFTELLWVAADTLQTQQVKLSFSLTTKYDTVRVKESELRRGYVHSSGRVLYNYGDTIIDIEKANTCTVRWYITVLNPEGIEIVESGKKKVESRKIIENGQLFIIVDDRKYNVLGQQIYKHN